MSGPYPEPAYPGPPEQGGGRTAGPLSGNPPYGGHSGVPRPPGFDFPAMPYGGLGAGPGNWGGEPPRQRRRTGVLVLAVVSALVIVGGIATAIVLLSGRGTGPAQAQSDAGLGPAPRPGDEGARGQNGIGTTPTGGQTATGSAEGTTSLAMAKGECANARLTSDDQHYLVAREVTCGSADSDLVLARLSTPATGCADHQYLRIDGPGGQVYCFTLDVRKGDCLDGSYLKTPCGSAEYTVLTTEAGPGNADSCSSANGATHWVPIGHDPVAVGCIGPARTS